ncbi:Trafficking protein particle complex III-specific subunit 85 [Komagataella phaffii CBS 7435]|uniref:Subunit of TRAPP (Transport protein particle) n=2 Tax=Komagataella phaffii TaxID=460519 RepID=C4R1Q5_KOMPG|nr:Subunit of TRAPP (transport protein particle) [Komagataella phaffii GS115]AOA63012.1 GQ67_00845T0 [Komagataella phaffii]CAH2448032.1 Trafficking protein particle complex III-specific subunit 85 [Komagataella phaffii CBS 7435]AOA67580.1 GQ68_00544T0 [Komagataella phaffii GS115]CAY69429.1 Subunit of TRAPP (transport protein particle) [Komagataella phaffii GS115]CCA38185.1 Trafficking protein particle complex III-specific subunit 85 [Komagataella phaffii CBS 7435]
MELTLVNLQKRFDRVESDDFSPFSVSIAVILHGFSPRVSISSTQLSDDIAKRFGFNNILQLMQYFQDDNIDSTQEVSIRFIESISDMPLQSFQTNEELFDLEEFHSSIYDMLKLIDQQLAETAVEAERSRLYKSVSLRFLSKILGGHTLSNFETFSHPIFQLFVLTTQDDCQSIGALYTQWKGTKVPFWVDLKEINPLCIIIVDLSIETDFQQGLWLRDSLKNKFGLSSLILSLNPNDKTKNLNETTIKRSVFAFSSHPEIMIIPKTLQEDIHGFYKHLTTKVVFPFMEKKVNEWHENLIVPRKSFSNRFWKGSKRSIETFSEQERQQGIDENGFNAVQGYYHHKSQEFKIRRLADWYFMMRDYKKSYTTYDLLKKDFLKDRSWTYLASLQDFMIFSLLIGASSKQASVPNEGNGNTVGITNKIINDLILPTIENLHYTYLSRCSLRTNTLRSCILMSELFISMGEAFMNELYLVQSIKLLRKLLSMKILQGSALAVIYQHISFAYTIYSRPLNHQEVSRPSDKLRIKNIDMEKLGLTRHRKASLWLLLAIKIIDPFQRPAYTKGLEQSIIKNLVQLMIEKGIDVDSNWRHVELCWLFRNGSLILNS